MASSLGLLQEYGSDDDAASPKSPSDEHNSEQKASNAQNKNEQEADNYNKENFKFDPSLSIVSKISVDAAPLVLYSNEHDEPRFIDENTKELTYNPRYEELWAPKYGPDNPKISDFHKASKNTLAGYVEQASVSEFQFENQRRQFINYGYAIDPSNTATVDKLIARRKEKEYEDEESVETNKQTDADELARLQNKKNSNAKRKTLRNNDPSDINGFTGPWAIYKDEVTVAKPTEEQRLELQELYAKKNKRLRFNQMVEEESKSVLHIDDPYDYMGRSFLHIPQDLDINLKSNEAPEKCFMPKKLLHSYKGHTKGIQKMQLFPQSGHIFLTCSMDSKVKLWEFYKGRRCIRTYQGHSQGVRDVSFNRDGTEFLSASYDRFIKLWDTETGAVKAKFTNKKIPYCVVFNTDEDKQNLFLAGTSDKKILCYDTRSGEIVQEYDRHLGAVNSVTFVDRNKRIVTTSDDKSVRVWEWDIPVDFKYIADPSMHSMPSVTLSRNGKYLAFQSMDNQIKIMEPLANFRWKSKKVFRGHMVAGYACGLDFSPDMSYIISGDADGHLVVWDFKTTRMFEKLKAHSQVCMDVKWHPHETSKVLTAGWDGVVNLWD